MIDSCQIPGCPEQATTIGVYHRRLGRLSTSKSFVPGALIEVLEEDIMLIDVKCICKFHEDPAAYHKRSIEQLNSA